jgi:DNA-binding IclR family transcriptional regulator
MSAPRGDVPGLERGIAILRLLRRDRRSLSAPEVAAELRLPRSTVHRLLHSLAGLGLLRREPSGAYALGPAVLALGFEYLASLDLVELSGPVLARLRDDIGCSTNLAVLDRANVLFVSRYAVRSAVSSSFGIGFSAPARKTAIGRLLLGELERDYAISDSLSSTIFPRGMIAISAPVRDARARIVAAINATTVVGAFSAKELRGPLKDKVLAAAGEISRRLGA